MQVQRDLLVQDVVTMMERHSAGAELGGVVAEIDKLFAQRYDVAQAEVTASIAVSTALALVTLPVVMFLVSRFVTA